MLNLLCPYPNLKKCQIQVGYKNLNTRKVISRYKFGTNIYDIKEVTAYHLGKQGTIKTEDSHEKDSLEKLAYKEVQDMTKV